MPGFLACDASMWGGALATHEGRRMCAPDHGGRGTAGRRRPGAA